MSLNFVIRHPVHTKQQRYPDVSLLSPLEEHEEEVFEWHKLLWDGLEWDVEVVTELLAD